MDLTETRRGVRYIDFTRAWPDHAGERAHEFANDKKGKPGVLHKLDIPMAAVIVTKKNDFRSPANILTRGGNKSYWITTRTWRDLVTSLPDGVPDPDDEVIATEQVGDGDGGDGDDSLQNPEGDTGTHASPSPPSGYSRGTNESSPPMGGLSERQGTRSGPLVLAPIVMDESEHFSFHDRLIEIRAYGERTPSDLYVNAGDVKTALGINYHPLPHDIEVTCATLPCGKEIDVLSYGEQMALMSAYRKKSEVAFHIVTWVNRLAFAAQYGRADVREKIEDAVDAQFSIVQGDRSDAHFSMRVGYYNYLLEVCSLSQLLELFPSAGGILDRLPEHADPSEYTVVKYGMGKADRPRAVVKELRRIFPGCNPVIVHTVRFPGATEQDAIDRETEWKVDFHDVNIKGVTHRRSSYTELFAVDADSSKRGVRRMDEMLENHNEQREQAMIADKAALDEANLRAREADFKAELLEQTVAEVKARNQRLESDVKAYKATLKKTMPRSLASKLDAILT